MQKMILNQNSNLGIGLVALLIILAATLSTQAQTVYKSNWILVYENDEDGNRVEGNKSDLIKAIQNGEAVRISWVHLISQEPLEKVEHLVDAGFLTIMNDETVLAQIAPMISQSPDFKGQHLILTENIEMGLIASTTGKNNYIRRNAITGEIIDHKSSKRGYKWFIHK